MLQTWTQLYPNDFTPHNNLALNYQFFGRYEDALKEALEAVRLNPNNASARSNLIGSFFGLSRFDEVQAAIEEMRKVNPNSPALYDAELALAYVRGDDAAMKRVSEAVAGKPFEYQFLDLQAAIAAGRGELRKAEALWKGNLQKFKSENARDLSSKTLLDLGFRQAAFGKCSEAKSNADEALKILRGRLSLPFAASIYAECGDIGRAQAALDEALKLYPKDTPIVNAAAPLVRALMARSRGNYDESLQHLESSRRFDFGLIAGIGNTYARGLTYLKQGRGAEAVAEFQKIIDRRGVNPISEQRPLAHLGLARAAAMSGDSGKARTAYQNFFALWKNADADLPVLQEAKKEYAQLQSP